ncbi:D-glycero-D-manno-heptose 1-phosphate guanosyltransferase, partial [Campylobacter coli]|nr:D-glycero-D-manno-heptose 1-phosphate guanosyltransferase [Campylobacter coli]
IFDNFDLEKKFSFEKFLQENFELLKIQTQIFNDYFIDIGIPEDYRRFMDDIFTPSK